MEPDAVPIGAAISGRVTSVRAYRIIAVVLFLASLAAAAPARGEDQNNAFVFVAPGIEAIPGPGSNLAAYQRSLQVRLTGDMAVAGGSVRIWLDGSEISPTQFRSGNVIQVPLPPLAPGEHSFRIVAPRLMGGTRDANWSFHVPLRAAGGASVAVAVDSPKRTLYEADEMQVTATGPPGGTAVCTIGDNVTFPLEQTKPGVYRGVHDVQSGEYVISAPVVVRITLPDGTLLIGQGTTPVKIYGQMFTVRIITPQPGETVPYNFYIKGRTRPHALVSITPNFGGPAVNQALPGGLPPAIGSVNSSLGSIEVKADRRGYFQQRFGFPLHFFTVTYSFVINAIAPDGTQAIPQLLTVRMAKPRKKKP